MKSRATWSLMALVVAAAVAARTVDLHESLRALLARIEELGPLAPLAFVALYVAATVALLPGAILTIGAGALFGLVQGTLLVSVGSTLGATAAFLLGRSLAREWVARKIEQNPRLRALDRAVAREGWKIVGLVRLSPVFPFNLVNYAFGLTRVGLRDYVLASWIGMLPATVMYVSIGAFAGSLASAPETGGPEGIGEVLLYGSGVAATVAVTVYVTRLTRKALETKLL